MFNFAQNKTAFTLAEVLITIGIIGVICALTIPNLIQNNFEKRTVSQLREIQSILSQTVRSAEEEYGDVTGWGLTGQNEASALIIAQNLKPYLKIAQDCGTVDNKGACFPLVPYKLLNKKNNSIIYATNKNYYKVKLLNGLSLFWRSGNSIEMSNDEYIDFLIDTNGVLPPNTFGKDVFLFIYEKHSIKPEGAPNTENQNTCNLDGNGIGCAYVILQNQNMNYLHKK
ncbi:hypothetical protein IJ541_00465 [bacterium]|nr:hypothetical protein [bacterium]